MAVTLKSRNIAERLQIRLRDQMEREARGEPIDPEIAARMTKPKEPERLYQVHVDVKGAKRPLPVGPKIGRDAAEMILAAVNGQICLGKLPAWGNARLEPCFNF